MINFNLCSALIAETKDNTWIIMIIFDTDNSMSKGGVPGNWASFKSPMIFDTLEQALSHAQLTLPKFGMDVEKYIQIQYLDGKRGKELSKNDLEFFKI